MSPVCSRRSISRRCSISSRTSCCNPGSPAVRTRIHSGASSARKIPTAHSTGSAQKDADLQRQLAELLDQIVQKLIEEGYLNLQQAPKMPGAQQPVLGPGGMAKEAAQQVQFNLTDKGIDFLGYRTL